MTTRLDLAIQKHPDHEEAIRLFAERDPSGNLKYLAWQVKVLESGQALAPEIADVVEGFHRHRAGHSRFGRGRSGGRSVEPLLRPDIYAYAPGDLAALRDTLRAIDRRQAKKIKRRERLYRLDGAMETEVVYEAADLVVRHIRNKEASIHYGLGTRWCIAMKREHYFDDYDAQNATFFFVERTAAARKGDQYDKAAIMLERTATGVVRELSLFTSLDQNVDIMALVGAYGERAFEILREVYRRSLVWPGSAVSRVMAGTATSAELDAVYEAVSAKKTTERMRVAGALVCSPLASWPLLARVLDDAPTLERRMDARDARGRLRRPRRVRGMRAFRWYVACALAIHPNVPEEERAALRKDLARRHVVLSSIHVDHQDDGPIVDYRLRGEEANERVGVYRRRRRARHRQRTRWTLSALVRRVGVLERRVKLAKGAVRKKKLALAKAAKAKAAKMTKAKKPKKKSRA